MNWPSDGRWDKKVPRWMSENKWHGWSGHKKDAVAL